MSKENYTPETPLGGQLEVYDIEREQEMLDEDSRKLA